jgi:cell division GTPase FtsZ
VAFDPELEDEMRITIIAANFENEESEATVEVVEEVKEEPAAPKKSEDDFFDGMF